jgi:hypothetical protein
MKMAVSIPDQVFTEAEELSKQLGVSHSELYTTALPQLAAKYPEEETVHRLNEVYETEDSTLDPGFRRAQAAVLRPEEW